ncbi:MAG: C39 family peptidase [Gammaproteobacteria bacterium]
MDEPEPSIEDDALDTLRLADTDTARRYPLPVLGPALWQPILPDHRAPEQNPREQQPPLDPSPETEAAGPSAPRTAPQPARPLAGHGLDIVLPDLPAGTLLVPSCALADTPHVAHRWTLRAGAGAAAWALPWVRPPAGPITGPRPKPQPESDPRARTAIDCFEIHAPLCGDATGPVRLCLEVEGPTAPRRYLITVSARAHQLEHAPTPSTTVAPIANVPALSQMTADAAIARRICSPTSLTMALMALTGDTQADVWRHIVTECHDPATGMYGIWPLALAAAARRGHPGAVELFSDWSAPLSALQRGIPVVTSIRFGADALPGAPLRETAGHLVVVVGAGPETIIVHDPAAPTPDTVARRYPAEAFARAWLANRGAAYILCA